MTNILTIDPGTTTGFAIGWFNGQDASVPGAGQADFFPVLKIVEEQLKSISDLVVVYERFVITARTAKLSQQTEALEVIGAVRWLCHAHGAKPPEPQPASAALKLVTDDRLRRLGWWRPGMVHANDALRHLALWMTVNGWLGLPT